MSIAPPGQSSPPPELPEMPAGVSRAGSWPAATWSPLVAWLGGFGIFAAASIVGSIIVLFSGDVDNPAPGFTFFGLLLQDSLLILGVWLVARANNARPSVQDVIGMRNTPIAKAIGYMAAIFFGYFILSGIWSQIVSSPKEELLQDIGADNSVLAAVAIAFVVCVAAPVAEETLFRGFIFGGLRRWKGFWPAALISGAMFGLAHAGGADVTYLLPLAIFGFGLALLYELTKSIYPGIYLHSLNNCLAFSVGLSLGWETAVVFIGSLSAVTLALIALRRVA